MVLSKFTEILQIQILFMGSNLRQNPTKSLFGGEFCIMTKMCLAVYFKMDVHACVQCTPTYLSYPPGPLSQE